MIKFFKNWKQKKDNKLNPNDVDLVLLRDKIIGMHLIDSKGPIALCDSLNLFISDPNELTAENFFNMWGPVLLPIFVRYKKPIVSIAKIIMAAAYTDVNALEQELEKNIKNEEERYQNFIDLWVEFISFYMHVSDRITFNIVGFEKRNEFMEILTNLIADLTLKYFYKQIKMNEEIFQKFIDHERDLLFEKFNKRHNEYSEASELMWKKDRIFDEFLGNSLLSKLSRNIAPRCGFDIKELSSGVNVPILPDLAILNTVVCNSYVGIMKDMNLESLIKNAANCL
jgi:hypothetical protein